MSVALLMDPQKQSTLQDDLESFFRIIVTLFARFHVHSDTGKSARTWVNVRFGPYFDCWWENGFTVAPSKRLQETVSGLLPIWVRPRENCPALVQLMSDLTALVRDFYQSLDTDRLEKCYGSSGSNDDPEWELLQSTVAFDHDAFLRLFNKALDHTTGWAENDKTKDQWTAGKSVSSAVDAIRSASAKRASDSSSSVPAPKRSRSMTTSGLLEVRDDVFSES